MCRVLTVVVPLLKSLTRAAAPLSRRPHSWDTRESNQTDHLIPDNLLHLSRLITCTQRLKRCTETLLA